jgi:hypothetical protein
MLFCTLFSISSYGSFVNTLALSSSLYLVFVTLTEHLFDLLFNLLESLVKALFNSLDLLFNLLESLVKALFNLLESLLKALFNCLDNLLDLHRTQTLLRRNFFIATPLAVVHTSGASRSSFIAFGFLEPTSLTSRRGPKSFRPIPC